MKVLVFDLDDTLYDELTYVKSGFHQVAFFLSKKIKVPSEIIFQWMWNRLHSHGRGAIFDDVLQEYNYYSKTMAKRCLSIYRTHKPDISLPLITIACLDELSNLPQYVVTDGNKLVQHNKLEALGLYQRMKHCYVTHRYGRQNQKPSPYCFLHILKKEKVEAEDVVYIGDNPRKDFVGIKPLGFKTIRIMTGQHKHIEMPKEYEAHERINSLKDIIQLLNK